MSPRWHRFVQSDSDHNIGDRLRALCSTAERHGHEHSTVNSPREAASEVDIMRARTATMKASRTSFVEAGLPERQVFVPLLAMYLFEEDVFSLVEGGRRAGVKVVFVGTKSRFESVPFRLIEVTSAFQQANGHVCGCADGF